MTTTPPSPQNAVLLQACTLQDIERMINRAVGERMKAFFEGCRQTAGHIFANPRCLCQGGVLGCTALGR